MPKYYQIVDDKIITEAEVSQAPDNMVAADDADHADTIAAYHARASRDALLSNTIDPIVSNPIRWADFSSDEQTSWTQYRLNLLNVPQQADFPQTINWPIKP